MTYRLTRKAEDDLTEVYLNGVREFGVEQAESYLAELLAAFELLSGNPHLARLREEFRPAVRIHPHGAHVIIYRDIENDVLIIRVRHGREDWQRGET
jgi:toxin ParE1/3/4